MSDPLYFSVLLVLVGSVIALFFVVLETCIPKQYDQIFHISNTERFGSGSPLDHERFCHIDCMVLVESVI